MNGECGPLSLQDHCFLHIICHLEQYRPAQLAHLPKHWRRSLLSCIAPAHLLRLEQTAVANGIETNPIWAEMSELTDSIWASYKVLDSIEDSWRDCFIGYIYHVLFNEKNRSFALKRISQLLFALHKERLNHDTTRYLSHHIQSFFISFPPYHLVPFRCPVSTGTDIALFLMEVGAFPKALEIYSGIVDGTVLWRERKNGVLGKLLSKVRSVKIHCDSSVCTNFILKAVTQTPDSVLEWVQLWNVTPATLSSGAFLFSHPYGYSALKKYEICTSKDDTQVVYPFLQVSKVSELLASVIRRQTSLEVLRLSNIHTFKPECMYSLCTAIAELLSQPQFEKLEIRYFDSMPLESVEVLINAFLSSSPANQQYVHLEGCEIVVDRMPTSEVTPHLAITDGRITGTERVVPSPLSNAALLPNTSRLSGLRKHLSFKSVEFPSELILWLCSMEYLYLHTLDFSSCYRTTTMAESPKDCFSQHLHFYVHHFHYEETKTPIALRQ